MQCRFVLTLLIAVLTQSVGAQERYEFYNGVRALGMGGAAVAVVNDETALLVNPAGLGRLRDYFITIADPEASISSEAEEIAGLDIMDATDPQKALDMANANLDRHLHARGGIFPSIVVPNFGFGIYGRSEVNSEVVSETDLFKYHYTRDWAGVFGFNLRLFNGIIKLGANARVTNRTEVRRDDLPTTSTDLRMEDLQREGIGVGSDAGLMLAAPIRWLPTLAAVYRDMGDTSYKLRDGMFNKTEEKPESTPETVDVAIALHPILGKRARATWTVEYRDVLTYSEEEKHTRRIHGGVEFNFADAFFLRAGMNQAYWTAGFELSMMNYQFQAASYGEDIGTPDLPREDRRYVVKFAFRF